MRVPLRLKVSLLWIAVSGVLAWALGLVLYLTSQRLYHEQFLANKLAVARTIARSIDGDVHARFTSLEAADDPEYLRYLRYLVDVKQVDPYITYLYTVSFDRDTGELAYAVDGDILDADTVYIESDSFAVWFAFNGDGELEVVAEEEPHTESFTFETADERELGVEIATAGGSPSLASCGQPVASIAREQPLAVRTPAGILDAATRELTAEITIDGSPVELTYTFSGTGESASTPAAPSSTRRRTSPSSGPSCGRTVTISSRWPTATSTATPSARTP